jgi:hypothetical protein
MKPINKLSIKDLRSMTQNQLITIIVKLNGDAGILKAKIKRRLKNGN